jgi:hypothetical protein
MRTWLFVPFATLVLESAAIADASYVCQPRAVEGATLRIDTSTGILCRNGGDPFDPSFCSTPSANTLSITSTRRGTLMGARGSVTFVEFVASGGERTEVVRIYAPRKNSMGMAFHPADLLGDLWVNAVTPDPAAPIDEARQPTCAELPTSEP